MTGFGPVGAAVASGPRPRIGVVGLGGIAQTVHLPLIRRRWDLFELTAIADLSAARTAEVGRLYGVPAGGQFSSWRDMADSGLVDAIMLLTGGDHGPDVAGVAERGIPVFCEKPLAFTQAGAQAVADVEARAGKPLVLLGYMKERDEALACAARALADVPPESIRMVEVRVLHPSDGAQLAFGNLLPAPDDVPTDVLAALGAADTASVEAALGALQDAPGASAKELRDWYTNVALGSIIHDVSVLRRLFGSVMTVESAWQWPLGAFPGSIQAVGAVGAARLHIGWHFIPEYPEYRETVAVHHEKGTVQLDFACPYLLNAPTRLTVTTEHDTVVTDTVARTVTESFETELAEFHALVTAGAPPLSGAAEGIADTRTAQNLWAALARSKGATPGGESATA